MAVLNLPIISLERMFLEPLSMSHSQGMFDLWSEPRVCEFSGPAVDSFGRPIPLPAESEVESDLLLHFWLDRARAATGFRWAVISSETREFIGAVGFNSLGDCSEFAYHLIPRWWGSGFGTEASRGAIDWSFGQGSTSIELFASPSNRKSIRLAERLGFETAGEPNDDLQRFMLTRSAYFCDF